MVTNIEKAILYSLEQARQDERKKAEKEIKKLEAEKEAEKREFILGALKEGMPMESVIRIIKMGEEDIKKLIS